MRGTPFALMILGASALAGQSKSAFEVASVRPSPVANSGGEGARRESIQADPGALSMRNVSLSSSIQWAYDVRPYQISGPDWLRDQRYDIAAKADHPVKTEQLRLMLQTLLADRFQLALHHHTRDLPAFVLLVGKN